MPTRTIELTEDQGTLVDELVRRGRFRDVDEVVREGLRLVVEDDDENDTFGWTDDELRAAVQVGLNDLDAGRYIEFNSVEALSAHIRGRTDDLLSGRRKPR